MVRDYSIRLHVLVCYTKQHRSYCVGSGLAVVLGTEFPTKIDSTKMSQFSFAVCATRRVSLYLRPRVTIGLRKQYKRSDTFEVVYIIDSVVFLYDFFWGQEFDEFAINLTVMHKLSAMFSLFCCLFTFSVCFLLLAFQATQFQFVGSYRPTVNEQNGNTRKCDCTSTMPVSAFQR